MRERADDLVTRGQGDKVKEVRLRFTSSPRPLVSLSPCPLVPLSLRRRRGFTLIEMLVAGMILALATAVIATAVSHSYGSLADARDERRAATLMDDLLTKVDLIGPNRIANEGPHSGKFD